MEFRYKLDFNLTQFASVQVAINFLEQSSFNYKIQQYLKNSGKKHYESTSVTDPRESEDSLFNQIQEWKGEFFDQVESMTHIPEFIKREIKYMIPRLADRKVAWLIDQRKKILLVPSLCECPDLEFYCHNLRWTSIGMIDDVKIFEHLYDQYIKKEKDVDLIYLFIEACIYCLKDYIMEIWNNLTEDNKRNINSGVFLFPKVVDYWIHCLSGSSELYWRRDIMNNFDRAGLNIVSFEYFLNLELEGVIRGDEFSISLSEYRNSTADTEEGTSCEERKRRKIYRILRGKVYIPLKNHGIRQCENYPIYKIKYIDMAALLFRRMSKPRRQGLMGKIEVYLRKHSSAFWPWQTLPIDIPISEGSNRKDLYYDYNEYFTFIVGMEDRYVHRKVDFMSNVKWNLNVEMEGKSGSEIKSFNNVYDLRMPCKIWDATPVHIKLNYFDHCDYYSDVYDVFSPWNQTPFLAYIINHENVQSVRECILNRCSKYCFCLLKKENYEEVNYFMEYFLRDDAERAKVRKGIDVYMILRDVFNKWDSVQRIEKVLDWLLCSEDESITFKKSLTHEECLRIILAIFRNKYAEFREAGLPWFFKFLNYSEDESIKLKKYLKTDSHFIEMLGKFVAKHHSKNRKIMLSCDIFSAEEVDQFLNGYSRSLKEKFFFHFLDRRKRFTNFSLLVRKSSE